MRTSGLVDVEVDAVKASPSEPPLLDMEKLKAVTISNTGIARSANWS